MFMAYINPNSNIFSALDSLISGVKPIEGEAFMSFEGSPIVLTFNLSYVDPNPVTIITMPPQMQWCVKTYQSYVKNYHTMHK